MQIASILLIIIGIIALIDGIVGINLYGKERYLYITIVGGIMLLGGLIMLFYCCDNSFYYSISQDVALDNYSRVLMI